jgi:transcriptional regulator with XRE-family HTH domain
VSLKEIRTAKGITQEDLEASSGVTQTTISSLERGTNKRPSWETVRRLASALNVAPDELFPVPDVNVDPEANDGAAR